MGTRRGVAHYDWDGVAVMRWYDYAVIVIVPVGITVAVLLYVWIALDVLIKWWAQ